MPTHEFECRSDILSTCPDGKAYEPRSVMKVKNENTDTPNNLCKSTNKKFIRIGK